MKLHIHNDRDSLADACAAFIASQAVEAAIQRGIFDLALSGGSTPTDTYIKLTLPPCSEQIDWQKTHVFWSDERCVPPNRPDSNYRLAYETLLQRVPIPAENIHRLLGELPPEDAAEAARSELDAHFGGGVPVFDLILLGLGEDGHTASLFPGTQALTAGQHFVAANYVNKLDTWRLTFTFPVLNHARNVVFLAMGENKADVVMQVVEESNPRLPASGVQPLTGELHWFLDKDAAQRLNR